MRKSSKIYNRNRGVALTQIKLAIVHFPYLGPYRPSSGDLVTDYINCNASMEFDAGTNLRILAL
jgi:hypothetical protein